jgi:hypothetical protein
MTGSGRGPGVEPARAVFPPGPSSVIMIDPTGAGRNIPAVPISQDSRLAMDAELKRDARSVIDRIVHLRDSL